MVAKVLTVSDGVVAGSREDASGAVIEEYLLANGFAVIERRVCADGRVPVADALSTMASGFHGVVISTGGTGFGPRDETPEATLAVVERHAPGLSEAMRAVHPLGRLSRGVAGVTGTSLIVNLPGSPKGCLEQLAAVIDVLPHAVALLVDNSDSHPVDAR